MPPIKQQAISAIVALPDDAALDDIMDTLSFRAHVEEGVAAVGRREGHPSGWGEAAGQGMALDGVMYQRFRGTLRPVRVFVPAAAPRPLTRAVDARWPSPWTMVLPAVTDPANGSRDSR